MVCDIEVCAWVYVWHECLLLYLLGSPCVGHTHTNIYIQCLHVCVLDLITTCAIENQQEELQATFIHTT